MPIQDSVGTYPSRMPAAYAGMVAELNGNRDIASRKIETASVAFGLAVGRGTADGSAKLAGSGFEGITVADKTRDSDSYDVGEVAAVIRKGVVWVTASNNVTPADPVTFTAATGVIGAGLVTTIVGAKFETTALAGALVRVYLG